tara:strand:- start:1094 stop:1312 length:219 start_codon:yes stop_codon:yes gene_type:complete
MNCILLAFLITNALFWGLFPHSAHCRVLDDFNKMLGMSIKCPTHAVHLMMGVVFFALSVYIAQKDYLDKMLF